MKSRLVNIRLDQERLRKVKALRAAGTTISDLVREAIDERYAKLSEPKFPLDIQGVRKRLFELYPDPPDLVEADYDVHDRDATRAHIIRLLKAKQARAFEDVAHDAGTAKRPE
jgi:hypothetical protein